ncbi:hypothetical protein ACF2G4_20215 (plasmid) [Pantoea sp. C3]|uniref:hypothetical protein n=1 Tax=Pantoea phytostimulans TaxID=2769024 RepID=UPI0038F60E3A
MDGFINKIPFLTVLTFLSYITYFSYKAGESYFYGYPISLIQVDFSTLIFTLMRVSIFLLFFAGIMWFFIASKSTFWDSLVFSTFSYVFVQVMDYFARGEFNFKSMVVSLSLFVVVFALCHFNKTLLNKEIATSQKKGAAIGSLLGLVAISFFTGNYFGPLLSVMEDNEGNVIISEFKDGFLTLKCHNNLSKSFTVIDIKDKKLSNINHEYLVRRFMAGECNPTLKYD